MLPICRDVTLKRSNDLVVFFSSYELESVFPSAINTYINLFVLQPGLLKSYDTLYSRSTNLFTNVTYLNLLNKYSNLLQFKMKMLFESNNFHFAKHRF